jgi:hypothetical protein
MFSDEINPNINLADNSDNVETVCNESPAEDVLVAEVSDEICDSDQSTEA